MSTIRLASRGELPCKSTPLSPCPSTKRPMSSGNRPHRCPGHRSEPGAGLDPELPAPAQLAAGGNSQHAWPRRSHRRQRAAQGSVSGRDAHHRRQRCRCWPIRRPISAPVRLRHRQSGRRSHRERRGRHRGSGIRVEVLDVPGHSPGHVVFLVRGHPASCSAATCCFKAASAVPISRRQHEAAVRGIRSKLYRLPADTIVYPGHGPATTIGEEMKSSVP